MKKRIALIALIAVLVLVLSFTLVACNGSLEEQIRDLQNKVNGYEADFAEKTITVYIGDKTFEVTTRQAFLSDVFEEMKDSGKISAYVINNGMITQIDDLQQDAASYKYYSVWHNVNEFAFKSAYSGYMPGRGETVTEGTPPYDTTFVCTHVDETLLYYSNVGVKLLPVVDGAAYAVFVD